MSGLIDKEELLRIIRHEFDLLDPVGAADSTIGYLRSVLTPAALNPRRKYGDIEIDTWWLTSGDDLHRRIFGDDL